MKLVRPGFQYLPSYIAALMRGWSPDNLAGSAKTIQELSEIDFDAAAFLAGLEDIEGAGPPIVLPDGSRVPRLPGFTRWIWDGEFCGSTNLRWMPGTTQLPDHVPGHIGYSVVPWKQRQGCATFALQSMLAGAALQGLPWVEVTTEVDNLASHKVIARCGGEFLEVFAKPLKLGGTEAARFRILTPERPGAIQQKSRVESLDLVL